MAAAFAVIVAGVLQLFYQTSLFLEQGEGECSTAPPLSNWIVTVAVLDLLLDMPIYPERYMHVPYICQLLVETVVTVLLTEFCCVFLWCRLEKVTCVLIESTLLSVGISKSTYNDWETSILGTATTTSSLLILATALKATDHVNTLRRRYLHKRRAGRRHCMQ